MVAINLTGTFHVIRAAVPHMKAARSGRIINVSSTAGQRGEAGHAHYAATKGALIALTKSLAAELAPDGILTNCVAPGWVETDMTPRDTVGPRQRCDPGPDPARARRAAGGDRRRSSCSWPRTWRRSSTARWSTSTAAPSSAAESAARRVRSREELRVRRVACEALGQQLHRLRGLERRERPAQQRHLRGTPRA